MHRQTGSVVQSTTSSTTAVASNIHHNPPGCGPVVTSGICPQRTSDDAIAVRIIRRCGVAEKRGMWDLRAWYNMGWLGWPWLAGLLVYRRRTRICQSVSSFDQRLGEY